MADTRPPPRRLSSVPAPRASTAPPASATRPSRRPPPPEPEAILAFPAPRGEIPEVTRYRSTWIVSSLQSLRERGHFERYDARLARHREAILDCVAAMWLPLDIAVAHYAACDELRLPVDEQVAMGRAVGARAQGSLLATAAKASRTAGVTPWTILPQFDRLWRRGADGGGVEVTKVGPKEARVVLVGCALFDIEYFRNAFRGVLLGIGAMFCESPYVNDVAHRRMPGEAIFQLQWV
jgi:hypothetical protein